MNTSLCMQNVSTSQVDKNPMGMTASLLGKPQVQYIEHRIGCAQVSKASMKSSCDIWPECSSCRYWALAELTNPLVLECQLDGHQAGRGIRIPLDTLISDASS